MNLSDLTIVQIVIHLITCYVVVLERIKPSMVQTPITHVLIFIAEFVIINQVYSNMN